MAKVPVFEPKIIDAVKKAGSKGISVVGLSEKAGCSTQQVRKVIGKVAGIVEVGKSDTAAILYGWDERVAKSGVVDGAMREVKKAAARRVARESVERVRRAGGDVVLTLDTNLIVIGIRRGVDGQTVVQLQDDDGGTVEMTPFT